MGTEQELKNLQPDHDNLIGIDSDGCVFDSMTEKQVKCFHSAFIDLYGIPNEVERAVRDCLEFVNLFSQTRGQDRFICFDLAVDLMHEHPDIKGKDAKIPDTAHLKAWLAAGPPYGNAGLEAAIRGERAAELQDSPELKNLMAWSLEVDIRVKALDVIPPFPNCKTFLEMVGNESDAMVVSSTPLSALNHEWDVNGIRSYIRFICSKDIGTKVLHLQLATEGGKYELDKVLMIGDAPKDMESAQEVGVRFYPINPGKEDDSWKRLHEEVYAKFIAGAYTQELEQQLIDEFLALLPANPPWVS